MSEQTKVTFKVHSLLWDRFNAQMESLPVSRDQFLNNVLKTEMHMLSEAMTGKRLSLKANRWVSGQLKLLGINTVNIGVEKQVAYDLNEIIKKHNIVRDAFFNRLIAFLRSSDTLLEYFELPKREDGHAGRRYADLARPVSPLLDLAEILNDPLNYLHLVAEGIHGANLYLLDFPSPKMDGFACWLDDADVPDSRLEKSRRQQEIDEIAKGLEEFELDALKPTKSG
jgi:hypothetical protein